MKVTLLVGVFALAVSGCACAGWERISPDTIKLSGDIGRFSYEEYLDVAAAGYSVAILNSPGGTPLVALKIAEDISNRNVDVVVDGFCASSCANYLVFAGKGLTVTCNSMVGWHGTLLATNDAVARMRAAGDPVGLIEAKAKWLTEFHDRERSYFKKTGIDYALLIDSVEIVREENIAPTVTFEFDQVTGDTSVSRGAALWVPTVEVLRAYGVDTSGFCAQKTREDIAAVIKKNGWNVAFVSVGRRAYPAVSKKLGR